jgi:hypothetical protein
LEVDVLEDVTQMALVIITAAAFGFPIHATYGAERHHHQEQAAASSELDDDKAKKAITTQKQHYQLSFTRCMEVVSQRTLAKVLLPAWALRLPVFGLSEVGLAFREFNQHLLDVVDRERALQRGERRRQRQLSASSAGEGKEAATEALGSVEKEKGQTLFRLLVQANEQGKDEEAEGNESKGEGTAVGAAVVVRGRRLDLGELLGNAFIFLLAGPYVLVVLLPSRSILTDLINHPFLSLPIPTPGHETSSHALTFALMLLAMHPEEQAALQAEVDAVLDAKPEGEALAYEDLDGLALCHGAMNEALRLFPPVVIIPKAAVQEGVELTSSEVGHGSLNGFDLRFEVYLVDFKF